MKANPAAREEFCTQLLAYELWLAWQAHFSADQVRRTVARQTLDHIVWVRTRNHNARMRGFPPCHEQCWHTASRLPR